MKRLFRNNTHEIAVLESSTSLALCPTNASTRASKQFWLDERLLTLACNQCMCSIYTHVVVSEVDKQPWYDTAGVSRVSPDLLQAYTGLSPLATVQKLLVLLCT